MSLLPRSQDSIEEIADAIGHDNLDKLESIGMLQARSPRILVGFTGGYHFHMYSKRVVQESHAKVWELLRSTMEELEEYLRGMSADSGWERLPYTHWTTHVTIALRLLGIYDISAQDYVIQR